MKRILTPASLRLALEGLLILALALIALSQYRSTQAAAEPAPQAPEALYWYVCNPTNHIGLFPERIHIFCQTTSPVAGAPALNSAIAWFTYPTASDTAAASRFMSLLQTSVITARPIWILVDPNDTSGSGFGCNPGDCRRIHGMEMR